MYLLPSHHWKTPYPFCVLAAFQGQQSDGPRRSTFSQNLSEFERRITAMLPEYRQKEEKVKE